MSEDLRQLGIYLTSIAFKPPHDEPLPFAGNCWQLKLQENQTGLQTRLPWGEAQDANELDTQELRHLQNCGALVRAKNLKTAALMETGAGVPVEDRTGVMLAEVVEPEGRI